MKILFILGSLFFAGNSMAAHLCQIQQDNLARHGSADNYTMVLRSVCTNAADNTPETMTVSAVSESDTARNDKNTLARLSVIKKYLDQGYELKDGLLVKP